MQNSANRYAMAVFKVGEDGVDLAVKHITSELAKG